jgi:hypothetical protein
MCSLWRAIGPSKRSFHVQTFLPPEVCLPSRPRISAGVRADNRCLSDSEPECVLCARQHSIIREVRRNQTRLADRHDLFLAEVHEAEDGFGVVAGAFGRGVMGRKPEAV